MGKDMELVSKLPKQERLSKDNLSTGSPQGSARLLLKMKPDSKAKLKMGDSKVFLQPNTAASYKAVSI